MNTTVIAGINVMHMSMTKFSDGSYDVRNHLTNERMVLTADQAKYLAEVLVQKFPVELEQK